MIGETIIGYLPQFLWETPKESNLTTAVKVIAICGPTNAGKSTLASLLVERLPAAQMVAFAEPLKRMLQRLMVLQGATEDEAWLYLTDPRLKNTSCPWLDMQTPRYAMRTLGSGWGRDLMGRDFWPSIWERRVMREPRTSVVCDDLRFPTEAEHVRACAGMIVRVERPGRGPGDHDSEQEYLRIEPDLVVVNDGSPFDMVAKVRSLL